MNAPIRSVSADTRKQFLWPVVGRKEWGFGPIAWFEDFFKAKSFVDQNIGKRTLFIGEPQEQMK